MALSGKSLSGQLGKKPVRRLYRPEITVTFSALSRNYEHAPLTNST
jgi:hypothetical protein